MPLMCPDLLPAERLPTDFQSRVGQYEAGASEIKRQALSRVGYQSFGLLYENGADGKQKDLPVGVSKRRDRGLERVFFNCAVCHTSTVRATPDSEPRLVLGMPANLFSLYDFERFFFQCAADPRFNTDNLIPQVQALGAELDIIDRRIVYPLAVWLMRDNVSRLESRLGFFYDQPGWGPGRVDTFSAAKAIFNWRWSEVPPHQAIGTADFPSIWLQAPRKIRSDGGPMELHWNGNNTSVEERNLSAAFGTGALPTNIDYAAVGRIEDWLLALEPPPYPFTIDNDLAARGAPIYQQYCASCHGATGRNFTGEHVGFVTPIEAIRTDRYRLDNYTHELATNQATLYAEAEYAGRDKRFKHFHKTYGYANMPLDGVWLRAPYLHNGSVPTLRDLLEPSSKRPQRFYRGNDVYDQVKAGFIHDVAGDHERQYFTFHTEIAGNSNQGHEGTAYGTNLSPEQKDALVEHLKTF